jgi:hypothetical protein
VNEYSRGGCVDVEVVVAGDSEVPHPPGDLLRRVAVEGGGGGGGGAACGRAQAGAVSECCGLDPAVGGLIPEQVVAGGIDDRGAAVSADLEVIEVGTLVAAVKLCPPAPSRQDPESTSLLPFSAVGRGYSARSITRSDDESSSSRDASRCTCVPTGTASSASVRRC